MASLVLYRTPAPAADPSPLSERIMSGMPPSHWESHQTERPPIFPGRLVQVDDSQSHSVHATMCCGFSACAFAHSVHLLLQTVLAPGVSRRCPDTAPNTAPATEASNSLTQRGDTAIELLTSTCSGAVAGGALLCGLPQSGRSVVRLALLFDSRCSTVVCLVLAAFSPVSRGFAYAEPHTIALLLHNCGRVGRHNKVHCTGLCLSPQRTWDGGEQRAGHTTRHSKRS